jgi:hypothetical protein
VIDVESISQPSAGEAFVIYPKQLLIIGRGIHIQQDGSIFPRHFQDIRPGEKLATPYFPLKLAQFTEQISIKQDRVRSLLLNPGHNHGSQRPGMFLHKALDQAGWNMGLVRQQEDCRAGLSGQGFHTRCYRGSLTVCPSLVGHHLNWQTADCLINRPQVSP